MAFVQLPPNPISASLSSIFSDFTNQESDGDGSPRNNLTPPLDLSSLATRLEIRRIGLEATQRELTAISRRLARLTNVHAPICRLPFEMLSRIFTFVPSSPLLLTRVSSHWRYVAINTPQLWASIPLKENNSEQIEVWLNRSKGSPSIEIAIHWGEQPKNLASRLTRFLVNDRYRRRLSSLSVAAGSSSVFELVCRLCGEHAEGLSPRLRDLTMKYTSYGSVPRSFRQQDFIKAICQWNIKHLELECVTLTELVPHLNDLDTLILRRTSGMNYPMLIRVLQASPSLRTLHLEHSNPSFNVSRGISEDRYSLDSLQKLTYIGMTEPLLFSLLSCIRTPGVKTLCIGLDTNSELIFDIINRTACPMPLVTALHWSFTPNWALPVAWNDMLLRLPKLNTLSLQCLPKDSLPSIVKALAKTSVHTLTIPHPSTYPNPSQGYKIVQELVTDKMHTSVPFRTIAFTGISPSLEGSPGKEFVASMEQAVDNVLENVSGLGPGFD